MYMALHINNRAVEDGVRNLASLTGESMTEAIGAAVEERLARVHSSHPDAPLPTPEEVMALVRSFKLKPRNEDLTEDEILGFGPGGFCE